MGMMWFLMKQFTGMGQRGSQDATSDGKGGVVAPFKSLIPRGTPMDVHFYISENGDWRNAASKQTPVWTAEGIPLGMGDSLIHPYVYYPSPRVQNNGSVYVHAVFTPSGASPDPGADDYDSALSFSRSRPLNAYLPKPRAQDGVNLLTGRNSTDGGAIPEDTVASNETVIVSFLKPNVTMVHVDDFK